MRILMVGVLVMLSACHSTRAVATEGTGNNAGFYFQEMPAPQDTREVALEPADLRVQRAGVIVLDVKYEMAFSAELRRHAPKFEAVVMGFSNREVQYRMPSAKLDALLEWLNAQDPKLIELESYDFSALDRTAEFYSVEARLEAARAARSRTLELFKLAVDIAEIERIENRLERQQAQIDGYEATLFEIKLRAGRVDVRIRLT